MYMKRTCNVNPTSPLGLGGLGWGVCFQPLFFQPFWFQPSGEGFTPPLPLQGTTSPSLLKCRKARPVPKRRRRPNCTDVAGKL